MHLFFIADRRLARRSDQISLLFRGSLRSGTWLLGLSFVRLLLAFRSFLFFQTLLFAQAKPTKLFSWALVAAKAERTARRRLATSLAGPPRKRTGISATPAPPGPSQHGPYAAPVGTAHAPSSRAWPNHHSVVECPAEVDHKGQSSMQTHTWSSRPAGDAAAQRTAAAGLTGQSCGRAVLIKLRQSTANPSSASSSTNCQEGTQRTHNTHKRAQVNSCARIH